jgi:RNA polymerase sigma factor (TIGR02999 family)
MCLGFRDADVLTATAQRCSLQGRNPTSPNTLDASISSLIAAADAGTPGARESLFGALYAELHRMAQRELGRSGVAASLGVTTLLHEAYLAMAARAGTTFPDRARFMGYAARVMRGLIVDHARERRAIKRGGQFELTTLGTEVEDLRVDHHWLSDIGAALDALARVDPSLAEVVDLRFFCGFSVPEIAALSATSERTVHRRWEKARLYLHEYLRPPPAAGTEAGADAGAAAGGPDGAATSI